MKARHVSWAAIAAILVAGAWTSSTTLGQGIRVEWEPPIRLSSPGQMAWFPDVAASDDGTVTVVWSGGARQGRTNFDALVLTQRRGGAWSRPVDVQAVPFVLDLSYATRNSIAIDRHGDVIATFRVPTILFFSRAPIDQATSARAWMPPRRLSGSNVAYYNELGEDARGRLHVVWSEIVVETSCEGCSEIFYRFSDDGGETWSAPRNLSQSPRLDSLKPHLWIAPDGWLYVSWQESEGLFVGGGRPAGVGIARSPDWGETWLGPQLITATVGTPQQAVIGQDRAGALLLVWRTSEGETLYAQRSLDRGETWSSPSPVSGFRARPWTQIPYDDYDIAADSLGRLHFVGTGAVGTEGQVGVWHMVWDGTAWNGPFLISANRNFPEWTRLAVSEGRRLHLVWFERDPESMYNTDTAVYSVWYSTALTDAPAVRRTPVPRPVFTPTPTRLVAPTPSPTPWTPPAAGFLSLPSGPPRPDMEAARLILWITVGVSLIGLLGWWVRQRLD